MKMIRSEFGDLDCSVPVLLLGGAANGAMIVRNLGRLGVPVACSAYGDCIAYASRYCGGRYEIPPDQEAAAFWHQLLLAPGTPALEGCVIFALDDGAVEFTARNHGELSRRYKLEAADPALRLMALDKMETLAVALKAGVGAPDYWPVSTPDDLAAIRDEVRFPAMVKPVHTHLFQPVMGCKLFIIEDSWEELEEKARLSLEHGLEIMVVEMIPGPDRLLSSYYTYIDDSGRSLFHYTKSIVRRYPVNQGPASYHKSEWLPETAEAGRAFFGAIPWRGFAALEFKRDTRDGVLKVIEVNPRFTEPHRLLVKGGMPADEIVYRSITGQPVPDVPSYAQDLFCWMPARDLLAFRALRKRGELSLAGWIRSLREGRIVFQVFSPRDPAPAFKRLRSEFGRLLRRLTG